VAARIGFTSAAIIGALFLLIPRQLLAIFGLRDPLVVALGVQLLHVLSLSGLLIAIALTYTGGLQGTGDTKSPLYISILSQVIVPLGICFAVQQTSRLDPIDIWLAILAGHATRCALSVLRFKQERWRNITVSIDGQTA
jgi:Na+-driven multidrug efflux pump